MTRSVRQAGRAYLVRRAGMTRPVDRITLTTSRSATARPRRPGRIAPRTPGSNACACKRIRDPSTCLSLRIHWLRQEMPDMLECPTHDTDEYNPLPARPRAA
jgi:hypothetical protein